MALRIPWDKQETAILIDAYLKVKTKELSQQEAIKEVSTLLRCRAVRSGIEIDEIFRNENGISMQMKIIAGLIDEKPSGLHSATKLFREMVDLYKNRRLEFDKILIQAKGGCAMQVRTQDEFFAWLSMRVSSDQLSELYIACRDIETFCISRHILSVPLFETADFKIVQSVKNAIETNKMFQFKHFRQIGKMKKVMEYYLSFLRENMVQQEALFNSIREHDTTLGKIMDYQSVKRINSENVEQESVVDMDASSRYADDNTGHVVSTREKIISKDEDVTSELNDIILANTEEKKDQNFAWNFAEGKIDFNFITPIEVSYFNEKRKCCGWQHAFVCIIEFLQEDYPAIIRGMVGYRFSGVGKVILTGKASLDRLSRAKEINDGLYLETDYTPDEIIAIVQLLMEKCNMDYSNIEIIYRKKQNESSIVVPCKSLETSVDKSRDEDSILTNKAIKYNENSSDEMDQDYITKIFDDMNISYIDNRKNNGCLWVLGNIELRSVLEKFAHYNVAFHYKPDGGRATKGEPAWWTKDSIDTLDTPIQDAIEKLTESQNFERENKLMTTSVYERKTNFENWLILNVGLAARSAESYASAINVAGQYSVRLGFSEKELYFILNAAQIYQISKKLLHNTEFAKLNESQHNRYSAALSKYWDYCNALTRETSQGISIKSESDSRDIVAKNRVAFIEWAKKQQMENGTILAYLSDIKKCNEFAKSYEYIKEEHLFLIEDINILECVFQKMKQDNRFVHLNNERQGRLSSVMNKLIAFRKTRECNTLGSSTSMLQVKPVEKLEQRSTISIVDSQVKERYTMILAENFVDGFRPEKAIDRNRFRIYYYDMFGQELDEEDEFLVRTLMDVGTLRDERIFVKDEIHQKDLLGEINETIMQTLDAGASCIYLGCLFAKFQEQLAEMLHIYNVDSLENVLFSSSNRIYYKRYNYLFGYKKEPSPAGDVVEYMMNSHLPVTYSEIENGLWYIPLDKIKHVLVTTPSIVNVASEAYLYAPNLPISESELRRVADLISHSLLQRNYISDVELIQLIEEQCPSVLMNTPNYPMWGLRNALAYLLREKFSFRGAIISNKDEEISMAEVFSDFCRQSEHITVDELKSFAGELNTVIYWDSVYDEMVRINQNEFVRQDQIRFNVEQTDAVLDSLIQSEYMPIKNVNLFLHFPTINVPWNNFVLESYVANYSKKFKLLHASYAATNCCGALVRQESDVSDYRTLIVDVLSKNSGWRTEKDALQLLVDLGYQQRRSYSDIEKVMQEAKIRMSVQKK